LADVIGHVQKKVAIARYGVWLLSYSIHEHMISKLDLSFSRARSVI
jgi:hypothetical protein